MHSNTNVGVEEQLTAVRAKEEEDMQRALAFAEQALEDGAGHIAFGRFFTSQTKPGGPSADVPLLRAARARFSVPIVAIGGITLDNAAPLLDAGADYLAVINGLFGAPDATAVQQRASQFSQLIHAF